MLSIASRRAPLSFEDADNLGPENAQSGPPEFKISKSFVNYFNVWRYGNDVYLDMGLVNRFVMSPVTFDDLVRRMTPLRERFKSEGQIRDGTIDTTKTT